MPGMKKSEKAIIIIEESIYYLGGYYSVLDQ